MALTGQADNMQVEFQLSGINGLCQTLTWMANLTDRDANHYASSLDGEHFIFTDIKDTVQVFICKIKRII